MYLFKVTNILFSASILLNFFTVFVLGNDQHTTTENLYQRLERLDRQGKYWLEWSVDWNNTRATFNVTVETTGYVGFGLSKKGKMAGADIVIGGVLPSGRAYFSDRHAVANQMPTKDKHQDWTLHLAWENRTHTFLSFSRPFDTCDEDHDLPIKGDTITLIWAYGEKDDNLQYHFQNRGRFQTYLLNPEPTPRRVQEAERSNERLTKLDDWNVWGIYATQKVAAKDTTYLCTFHKAPSHSTKQHIVGYRPIVYSDVDRRYIHHFMMMRCYPPTGVNAKQFFHRFTDRPGVECYNLHVPSNIPTEHCREYMYGFGVGGKSFFLPPNIGISLSESADEYYLLQTHYNNPESTPGIEVNYGLELFYTDKIRKYDAGVMYIGHGFPGSPSLLLPSHSVNHVLHGHCGGSCTRRMFPSKGVKFVAALLHTHLTGVAIKLAHVRNGRELAPIWNDDNYMFDYQPVQTLRKERTVLPGDSLYSRCLYTTTDRNESSATVGGFSSLNEMCNLVVWYYPRAAYRNNVDKNLTVHSVCNSELRTTEYRDFLNIQNYTWSDAKLENVVTAPAENAGLTTKEVGTRTEWTTEKRNDLQNFHKYSPHVTWCPDQGPDAVGTPSSLPSLGNLPNWRNNEYLSTSYEDHVIPYKPTALCSG